MAADEEDKLKNPETMAVDDRGAEPRPLDVNRMRIKLMIVCHNIHGQENGAHYLIRRGWETTVVGSIKEAFQTIGRFKPDFILLSVNLRTTKIFEIPTIIYNTFKIPVITFGESLEAYTQKRLQDVASRYSLPGFASGPSIHRKIKSVLQEIYNSDDIEAKNIFTRQRELFEQSADVEAGGRRPKRGYTFITEDHPVAENKNDKIRRFYEEEDEERQYRLSHEKELENAAATNELGDGVDVSEETADEAESLEELVALAKEQSQEHDESHVITTRTHATQSRKNDINLAKSYRRDPANVKAIEAMEHFIIQSARTAAAKVMHPVKSIDGSMTCTVWPVICAEVAGFIVVSHGGSVADETTFNDKFIKSVRDFGQKVCVDFEIDEHLITNLENVDLKQKIDGELFTATIPSGRNEIIIKFIEAHAAAPTLSMEPLLGRARVKVSELVAELAPGADLYLHMPKNNRYFMYLKMNGILSEKQKEKLLATNAAVFINSTDLEKYSRTHAKNITVQKLRDLKKKTAA